jgi:hypothetical protein
MQIVTKKSQKSPPNFRCELCDYNTCNKKDYDKHLMTLKHKKNENNDKNDANLSQKSQFECECGKIYKYRQGLYHHKKTCNGINISNVTMCDNEIIHFLIKENSEFKNMIMEIVKNGIHNTNNTNNTNNSNHTNSHNKTFNLQVFLNETCKNAMNITDFMESIQLQLSDLEDVGELGYVNGISNIIIKNLKELDITERPIHCTDAKREVLYVKDQNKWEKETEQKERMVLFVKNVANKNIRMLNEFKKKYPDCIDRDSNMSDHYNKLVMESMGGNGDNYNNKHDRIIKKISKEVIIDKETI